MSKVMFSMPDELYSRLKATIPARERSKVAAVLFEKEINQREHALYLSAKELEDSKSLREEMVVWNNDFGGDGLENV
jgi:hypothetical protein